MTTLHTALPVRPPAVALRCACVLAVVALALEYGFDEPPLSTQVIRIVQLATLLAYGAVRIAELISASVRWPVIKKRAPEGLVAFIALSTAVRYQVEWPDVLLAAVIYVLIVELYKVFTVGAGNLSGRTSHPSAPRHPARLMLTAFTSLILIGGLLLSLPKALSQDKRIETEHDVGQRVLDCFFTATSATCVTGLVVYDTGQDFTRFGQVVILLLIQLGGLGIMVFGSIFGLLLRRELSLRESLALQDIYSHQTIGEIGRLIAFICVSTLGIEAVCAALLYGSWPADMTASSTRWFYSIFHAVSAFCNAGFALDHDSLIRLRTEWAPYVVIMPAIVLGGLGFPVLADVGRWLWIRGRTLALRLRQNQNTSTLLPHKAISRLRLHSKLVLLMTAMLIIVPACLLLLFESGGGAGGENSGGAVMQTMPFGQRILAAVFQSVTCRTAGFYTASLAVDDISTPSLFLMCILMFIGGSPASTAGGVKTVAIAILVMGTVATLHKREQVEAFHRRIPASTIRQASVVIMAMFSLVSVVVLVLSYTESASLAEVLFESVSACGTVGLSTGLTPHLTIPGKLVIMLSMFAGRLGPLTLLVALAGRERAESFSYPAEQITIG